MKQLTIFDALNKVEVKRQKKLHYRVLSIRQPWTWLIVNGYKNIENRNWHTAIKGMILIHASKGMTKEEYADCINFMAWKKIKVNLPEFDQLERGGIVGYATVVDCVADSDNPWFVGPYGIVFQNPKSVPLIPCQGQRKIFDIRLHNDNLPNPYKIDRAINQEINSTTVLRQK